MLSSVLGLGLWLGLGFKPSSPELVLSLTRLSFPLVRFSMEDKMAAGAFEHARNYG